MLLLCLLTVNVALLDTAETGITTKFVDELEDVLRRANIRVQIVTEEQQKEYIAYPLIVVCLADTRLSADIETSLEKVTCTFLILICSF